MLISMNACIYAMVELECPHCEATIELEDGAYGDFECPLCEGEFEFGEPPVQSIQPSQSVQSVQPHQAKGSGFDSTMKILTGVSLGATIFVLLAVIVIVIMVILLLGLALSSLDGSIMGG